MHPLQNGSQATVRPANKPTVGLGGWFTESGDNNVPSYPGADWFNHVIAEFQNVLASQGVVFDPSSDENLKTAFDYVYSKTGMDFIDVSTLVATNAPISVGLFVRTFKFNAPVITTWEIVSSGNGDLSDGTIALDNGLFAKIYDTGQVSVRSYGAYGNAIKGGGGDDDTLAWRNAITNHAVVHGHHDDIYLITEPVTSNRSGTKVWMNSAKVIWRGVAPAQDYTGRDRGCFEFKGSPGLVIETLQLTSVLAEFSQQYPTTDASLISNHRFVRVGCGSLPNAAFSLLAVPKSDMTGTTITLDYINGWEYDAGNFINYQSVSVIENCIISDFEFIDETTNPTESEDDDICAVVFQYAHDCHALNVKGDKTNNPLIFGHYCHKCSAVDAYLRDPKKPTEGGRGYIAQWNNSVYCLSSGLRGIGVRHVNDFTQSAYCAVVHSGAIDDQGSFITHGSYEHDLVYYDVNGVVTFANSGVDFGQSAKRIRLEKASGDLLRARTNVIDLTVKDAYFKDAILNSVGLIADKLIVNGSFQLNNWSKSLGKPESTLRKGAHIASSELANSSTIMFDQNMDADDRVHISSSRLTLKPSDFRGGSLHFDHCHLKVSNLLFFSNSMSSLTLDSCEGDGFGVRFQDQNSPVSFVVNGGKYYGTNGADMWLSLRDASGTSPVYISVSNAEIDGSSFDEIIEDNYSAGNNDQYTVSFKGNTLKNAAIQIPNGRYDQGAIVYVNNIEKNITKVGAVASSNRVFANNAVSL
ncbi:hypothetical protein ACK3GY_002073 [Vibrio parahaemolyticus]